VENLLVALLDVLLEVCSEFLLQIFFELVAEA